MIITCRDCGLDREKAKGQSGNICAECSNAYQREYRAKNRERIRQQLKQKHAENRKDPAWVAGERKRGREYWAALRHEVIMAYGGYRCACCGETEPMFLTIDHVFNDGAAHRRSLGYGKQNGQGASSRTMKWIKDHGFPSGFQILCSNCNTGKARNGGVCPHKANTEENRVNSGDAQTG